MAAFLLVKKRRGRRLIGPRCLKGPIQWSCKRVFCPPARAPPLVQAPPPTQALHPSATRSGVPLPLPLRDSLMPLPPVQPDHPSPLPSILLLLLPHTRRRRIRVLVRHASPQGPKLADHLWMPNSLPLSSSFSETMAAERGPWTEKMLHWGTSIYNHKVSLSLLSSSWSARTTKPSSLKPNMASSDQRKVLGPFLRPGANWGSLSGRRLTSKPCEPLWI